MKSLHWFGYIALFFALPFTFTNNAVAASFYYCDNSETSTKCTAQAVNSTNWSNVSGTHMWGPLPNSAAYNSTNTSSYPSKQTYYWLFKTVSGADGGLYYTPSVWVYDNRFVDVVRYEFEYTYSTTLDQEYATGGWNTLASIATDFSGDVYLQASRSSYYGGMGADCAMIDNS